MSKKQYRQFKLTNNDEIICEVLQWDTQDNAAILVKGALKILNFDDLSRGVRLFAFRPWMGLQDDIDLYQTINAAHVIGEVLPSDNLMKYYNRTLKEIKSMMEKKRYPDLDLDEVLQKFPADGTDEEFDNYISDVLARPEDLNDSSDPTNNHDNVIKFKPKGTLH